MPDSVGASSSSTVTITVGTPLNGEIETAYDEDWYRVSLTANVTYTIRLVGRGTGSNTLVDPFIDGIYNSNDSYVGGFNNDGLISGPYGRDAMTTFRPTSSGYYWIAAMGDLGSIGTFTISVTDSSGGADNVLASTATTSSVSVGGFANGTIDTAGDVDWYRVSFAAGTSYTIRLLGLTSNAGTLPDPVIAGIYNSSGAFIPNTYVDDFTTREAALDFVAPYSGHYYIAARGWNTYTGSFRLEVATTTPDVAGNTGTTASLAIGASTTVQMGQPYDHDWYGVSLVAGTTYEFKLSGAGFDNTTPFIHGIFNSSGQYVGSYAGPVLGVGSASATTIFTPTASGTYYIDAFSIYEGTYTLSAQQVANDVPGNQTSTATVAVGGSVTGRIDGATDVDWYAVNLVANTTYEIRLRGAQSGNGTLEDPVIAGIYNASGVVQRNSFADDTDGTEASLMFRPTASGTYYIAADGYAGYTGTFRLSVDARPSDVGPDMDNASPLTLNTPTTVTLDAPADVDWYSVNLTGGSTYGIRLMGAATKRGTLYDPVLVGVYDSTGVMVADTYVDDSRGLLDSILQFTPASSGTYYIVADGYDRFAGTARLTVSIDNIGTTNATAGTFTAGTALEGIIDYGGDIDRYEVTLDANSTYYVRMLGYFSRSGDLADPHISGIFFGTGSTNVGTAIVDATGADPVIGTDAWFRVATGANGGAYYVATTGNANTDGAFLLTADKDIAGSQATTATVEVGGSVTSYIDEGTDADWFAVSLTAGYSYVIKMQGSQYGNGTLIDPYINGVRFSSTPTTIISGTSGTSVDNNDGRDSVVRLTASTTGTYYIAAQSSGTIVGSYRITVSGDVGENASAAVVLPINSSVMGTIDDTTDTDWYAVTVVANTSYVFQMQGVDSGAGTLDDPVINGIVNSGGSTQSGVTITSAGLDSYARWIPGTSGTFYIRATGGGTDTGTFRLTALAEVGHTSTTASSVTVGGTAVGSIDAPSDVDWYAVSLLANTSYIFKMEGVDGGGGTLSAAVIGGIVNASGTAQSGVIITSAGSDSYARWITGASNGTFYINATSTGRSMGSFTLTVASEVGHTAASASSFAVGTPVSGAIDVAGDSDWYAITVTTSNAYIFKMEGVDGGGGTLAGAAIGGILNASGTAQSGVTITSAGSDSFARWIPAANGTYYINATGTSTNMGTFRLSAMTEIGHTAASASSVSVGTPVSGTIDVAGDSDWYAITVTANTSYIFKMEGADSGGGTLGGAIIGGILSSTGAAQSGVTTSSLGSNAYARWVPTANGTYYIDASGSGANMGTFRLSVSTGDIGHTSATASSLTVGTPVNGTMDMPNDSDWYAISVTANTAYLFKMQGADSGGGTLGAAVIGGILSSTGAAQSGVTVSFLGSDSYARWVPTSSGTYYVDASSASIGTFRLSASTADIGHTSATASSLTIGQSVSGTIDMPDDSDWYAITVTANTAYLFKMQGADSGGGTLTAAAIGGILSSTGTAQSGVTISTLGSDAYARWVPTSSGTYYINASGTNIGTFTLSASTEVGHTTASYATMAVGDTASGTIDMPDDSDWYRFAHSGSTGYLIRLSGAGSGGGTLDTPILNGIMNSSGAALNDEVIFTSGGDAIMRWSPTSTTATNYFIDVGGGGIGTFTLSIEQEAGDTTAGAWTLPVDGSMTGTIDDSTDTDWYKVSLAGNTDYVFRISGVSSNGGTLADPHILLRNSTGTVVTSGVTTIENGTDTTLLYRTGFSSGTWHIDAQGSGAVGTYTVSAAVEVGSTNTSAPTMTLGTPIFGSIDYDGDTDRYRVSLAANTQYRVRMEGLDSGNGTLADPFINGVRLGTNSNRANSVQDGGGTGRDAVAIFTTGTSGTYYIDADATADSTGTYRLTIELWP